MTPCRVVQVDNSDNSNDDIPLPIIRKNLHCIKQPRSQEEHTHGDIQATHSQYTQTDPHLTTITAYTFH